jgi:hypothetical protein
MFNIQSKTEIIFHFNKISLQDPNIPMWVIKVKGETYYVDHVDVESGVGFSTKETPDNPSTKGSIKFKAKLKIEKINNRVIATIYP